MLMKRLAHGANANPPMAGNGACQLAHPDFGASEREGVEALFVVVSGAKA
jgi:hypothetical protein